MGYELYDGNLFLLYINKWIYGTSNPIVEFRH